MGMPTATVAVEKKFCCSYKILLLLLIRNRRCGTRSCHLEGFHGDLQEQAGGTRGFVGKAVYWGHRAPEHPRLQSTQGSMSIDIIRTGIARAALATAAEALFGDMVKAVVDVRRNVMAIGGELHSDEESVLLEDGSEQNDLWGINLYPAEKGDDWIEFDSMINVRPSVKNRSRDVEDQALRESIRAVVRDLLEE